jgi:hypothetical protein
LPEISDYAVITSDLKIKDTFLINRFKKLLQKTQKILNSNSFEENKIDKIFQENYKKDILKRIELMIKNII